MTKLQSKRIQLAYFAPIIMIILGILLYSVILPDRYNKIISVIDWLFSGTDNIIATLRSSNIVLGQLYKILFTKVIVWIWTIGFLFSIFWCGYTIQNSKNRNSNLIMADKVKIALIARLLNTTEQTYKLNKNNINNKKIHKLTLDLQSKILTCGDFGYGNDDITRLENDICNMLLEIEENIHNNDLNSIFNKYMKIENLIQERDALLKHY